MNGSANKLLKVLIIVGGVIVLGILAALFSLRHDYKPDGRYRVAMAGRSVMDQWFKYWNWPSLLHDRAIYRAWPIPYTRYAREGIFLEYVPMESPHVKSEGEEYGARMFESIRRQVDGEKYDALFFKFCFVDFSDKRWNDEVAAARGYANMTSFVEKVHSFAKERHLKFILGNALPSQIPGRYAQQVRLDFNRWAEQYAAAHPEIVLVDLFTPLTDNAGIMKAGLARDPEDSHVNRKGYKVLDEELFPKLRKAAKR